MFIVAQLVGFLAFIVSLLSYYKNKKKDIFKSQVLANTLEILSYLLLNANSGFLVKIIAFIRNSIIVLKEKYKFLDTKIIPIIFLLIYIVCIIIKFKNLKFSITLKCIKKILLIILPFIGAISYTIITWNGNELSVKKSSIYCTIPWLIYNIMVLSIFGIVSNITSIISGFIAVKKYLNEGNE